MAAAGRYQFIVAGRRGSAGGCGFCLLRFARKRAVSCGLRETARFRAVSEPGPGVSTVIIIIIIIIIIVHVLICICRLLLLLLFLLVVAAVQHPKIIIIIIIILILDRISEPC